MFSSEPQPTAEQLREWELIKGTPKPMSDHERATDMIHGLVNRMPENQKSALLADPKFKTWWISVDDLRRLTK